MNGNRNYPPYRTDCNHMPARSSCPNVPPTSCPCHALPKPPIPPQLPKGQLLQLINEVSFAIDDILLYLDTHPCDEKALSYFKECSLLRNAALKEYAARFGPLTIDTAEDVSSDSWEWVMQPWPWEGGAC